MIDENSITTRKALPTDLNDLLLFEQGVILAERPYDSTLGTDPISYYDIEELIESNEAELLIVTSNEQIIGSGYAKILKAKPYLAHEQYGYLGFMFVSPEFRGQGVNKRIIQGLFEWLSSNNVHEARLDVYDKNISAVKAYEKVGFEAHLLNMRLSI